MTEADQRRNSTLPQFLAERARNASDARLALNAAAGLIAVAAAAALRPYGWIATLAAGLCFVVFGFWGIADRELSERRATISSFGVGMLLAARWIAAGLGVVAGLTLIYSLAALTLGTWIS